MRRLTLSLIAVILLALLGLSWIIDQWYWQQFAQDDKTINSYKRLATELVQQLNAQHLDPAQLQSWAIHSLLQPQIVPYADFPLPENLIADFERGNPLLLDSAEQVSLHYFLPDSQSVLSINLPAHDASGKSHVIKMALTLIFYGGVIGFVLLWLTPLLRRLDLLRAAAGAIGRGELGRRIPLSNVSYIGDIEQEFNAMAARLQNVIQDNKILSRGCPMIYAHHWPGCALV